MLETSTLIYLFIAFGIPATIRFMRSGDRITQTIPTSRLTRFSNLLLLLSMTYYVVSAFLFPAPDLFQMVKVSPEAPLYLVRNHLRAYLESNPLPDEEVEYLWNVYEQFRSNEARRIYAIYGEHALLKCTWCREETDYMLFTLPSVAASYLFMFVLVGVISSGCERRYTRSYSIMALVVLGSLDLASLLFDQALGLNVGFAKIELYRKCAFAAMCFLLWAVGYADPVTEVEICQKLIADSERVVGQIQTVRLMRMLSLRDAELREPYLAYFKNLEKEHTAVSEDPEYRKIVAKVSEKVQLDKLIAEAKMAAQNILHSAKGEVKKSE
jgi:hypothetical protein